MLVLLFCLSAWRISRFMMNLLKMELLEMMGKSHGRSIFCGSIHYDIFVLYLVAGVQFIVQSWHVKLPFLIIGIGCVGVSEVEVYCFKRAVLQKKLS